MARVLSQSALNLRQFASTLPFFPAPPLRHSRGLRFPWTICIRPGSRLRLSLGKPTIVEAVPMSVEKEW